MLGLAHAENRANAPYQGALLHRENDFRLKSLNSIACRDRSRAMKSTRGLKSLEMLSKGPEIKTNSISFVWVLDYFQEANKKVQILHSNDFKHLLRVLRIKYTCIL